VVQRSLPLLLSHNATVNATTTAVDVSTGIRPALLTPLLPQYCFIHVTDVNMLTTPLLLVASLRYSSCVAYV
jgi:hypothetical protein